MFSYVSLCCFFFKQKAAYEMRISDWSSDVCSSDLKKRVHSGILEDRPLGLIAPAAVGTDNDIFISAHLENVGVQFIHCSHDEVIRPGGDLIAGLIQDFKG